MNKIPAKASDPNDLERHILDPNIAKSEADWWAKRRIEELEREVERFKEDHGQACLLVAKMHAAAVGEITGPKRGVVEDVEDLRLERDALLADNERLREALQRIRSGMYNVLYCEDIAREALVSIPDQSLARIRNQILDTCIEVAKVRGTNRTVEAITAMKEPE